MSLDLMNYSFHISGFVCFLCSVLLFLCAGLNLCGMLINERGTAWKHVSQEERQLRTGRSNAAVFFWGVLGEWILKLKYGENTYWGSITSHHTHTILRFHSGQRCSLEEAETVSSLQILKLIWFYTRFVVLHA